MKSQFGESVRTLSEKHHLCQPRVVGLLEMDMSHLCKIVMDIWQLKRSQITILADRLKANSDELVTLFFADQFYSIFEVKKILTVAVRVVENNIRN